jgi:hypothetical protein
MPKVPKMPKFVVSLRSIFFKIDKIPSFEIRHSTFVIHRPGTSSSLTSCPVNPKNRWRFSRDMTRVLVLTRG